MNEIIAMGLICAVVLVIAGAYAVGNVLMNTIIKRVVSFIRWQFVKKRPEDVFEDTYWKEEK